MPDYDYELVVIGGGPAGEKGAAQAAYFGHATVNTMSLMIRDP